MVVCDVNLDVWSMGMSMKVCAAVLSFKFWECVDRAYVRWKIVESV